MHQVEVRHVERQWQEQPVEALPAITEDVGGRRLFHRVRAVPFFLHHRRELLPDRWVCVRGVVVVETQMQVHLQQVHRERPGRRIGLGNAAQELLVMRHEILLDVLGRHRPAALDEAGQRRVMPVLRRILHPQRIA